METHTFHPQSRVWVYTSSRPLFEGEVQNLEDMLDAFCSSWTAHDNRLFASSLVLLGRFVVLVVDETQAGASGCSIDKSVHFLDSAGKKLDCDFMTRDLVAYQSKGEWTWINFRDIPNRLSRGEMDAGTICIDTTVATLNELHNWEKPMKETWLKRYLKTKP